jgi:alkylation response protein AidB-like acyl-CoA dehydrogenase
MDPRHSSEAEQFRMRIRDLLADNLPEGWNGIGAITDRDEADDFVTSWRATLAANGLLGVSWPTEYGGAGLSKLEQVVLVEELARAGLPAMGYNDNFSIKMRGGTLLRWGTEAQKRRLRVVDIFPLSQKMRGHPELIAADGLHPSAKTYALWEELIFPAARDLLEK